VFAISEEPLDVDAAVAAVRSDADGGLVTFVGYVRETSDDGRLVDGLEYEAYLEPAVAAMTQIGADAVARFDVRAVAIVHRVGSLGLGEAAVVVAVAAAHRRAAFAACEFAIDELKLRVPIWKRERYRSGQAGWRENALPPA